MGEVIAFPRKPKRIELINAELDWYLDMLGHGYHPDEAVTVLAQARAAYGAAGRGYFPFSRSNPLGWCVLGMHRVSLVRAFMHARKNTFYNCSSS